MWSSDEQVMKEESLTNSKGFSMKQIMKQKILKLHTAKLLKVLAEKEKT